MRNNSKKWPCLARIEQKNEKKCNLRTAFLAHFPKNALKYALTNTFEQ